MKVSPRQNSIGQQNSNGQKNGNGRQKVPVFSSDGIELAPCNAARARRLVKNRQATVRTVSPFSIALKRSVTPDA
ncbi:RRXRR domain-containing protein [Methylomonas koyamae]|uniref:RRXRR domain-containing protein n=1 Tax=Methylomonas koyamae TaxID=702114 RepID=UPI0009EECF3E